MEKIFVICSNTYDVDLCINYFKKIMSFLGISIMYCHNEISVGRYHYIFISKTDPDSINKFKTIKEYRKVYSEDIEDLYFKFKNKVEKILF